MGGFLKLSLGIWSVLAVIACVHSISGQVADEPVDCSSGPKMQKPSQGKYIVSFGVLNARAIKLVKPKYPNAARAVTVSGRVTIGILIDPCGCVHEVKQVSGHPFLVSSSIDAARRSIFSPATISGRPVWVNGIIVYNFLSTRANWLQIGFWSDSAASLNDFLPDQFQIVRRELALGRHVEGQNNLDQVNLMVIDLIRNDLISDQKSLWLFDTGRTLKQLARSEDTATIARLKELVSTAPHDVAHQLRSLLADLLESGNRSELERRRKQIEDRMYGLGL